ncbi:MAG: NTP transferase domain-containing protein [Cyclobacteriaceae bacterium]|nr:NTP transferase domain-containing protein [Cyclobacteriaceae bacterium]
MTSITLNGLILAGGRSSRMGVDKSSITYFEIPQHQHLAKLLQPLCNRVFIACRKAPETATVPILTDQFDFEGPLNGILTAFYHSPEAAWLTVPVDMPLIDTHLLEILVNGRDPEKIVTCFFDSDGLHPEPLIAIWEPAAFAALKEFCKQGRNSPREFIQNHPATLLHAPDTKYLININTPEELAEWKKNLQPKITSG